MKKRKLLKINIILWVAVYILFIMLNRQSYCASINMSISKTSAYVGDSFTVTLSGINGKLTISGNSNISLNPSGTVFVDGSLTITGKANSVGTGTITITPIDVTTTDAEPVEIKTGASRTINITQKPAEPQQPAPQTNNQSNNSSNKNTSSTSSNKTNNSKTSKKTTTQEQPKEVIAEEEATPQFGVYGLTITGLKENGEEEELEFTPEFNINVFEYNMEVENYIEDLKITPYADPYSEFVSIEKPDILKIGENEILIKIANNENNITYKIKVIRKESPISVTDELDNIDANMQVGPKTVTMPVWLFTLIILSVIIVEAIILKWSLVKSLLMHKKYYDVK